MKKNEKIKKFIKYNGLKFIDVAKEIGVSNIHLNAVLCSRRKMSPATHQKIYLFIKSLFSKKKAQQLRWQREVQDLLDEMESDIKN